MLYNLSYRRAYAVHKLLQQLQRRAVCGYKVVFPVGNKRDFFGRFKIRFKSFAYVVADLRGVRLRLLHVGISQRGNIYRFALRYAHIDGQGVQKVRKLARKQVRCYRRGWRKKRLPLVQNG